MKNKLFIIISILALVSLVGAIKFFSVEDNWVCVGDKWVRHGNPDKEKSSQECGNDTKIKEDLKNSCQDNNGTWLEEYMECEYVGQKWCIDVGGVFDECTSACRHNPGAELCTMQCVPVCVFDKDNIKPKQSVSPRDASYVLDGEVVYLSDGQGVVSKRGSRVSLWAESSGDLDGDGLVDRAVVLTEDTQGSGIFFYVAVALFKNGAYHGGNGIFIGDRVAPQNLSIVDGLALLNYADRRPEDAMSVRPSQADSAWFEVFDGELKRISAKLDQNKNNRVAIKLYNPSRLDSIVSPFEIEGEARGNWFFEASFPVILVNWDGLIIAQGIAQAEGDWMTEEFVPFKARLEFDKPEYKNNGALILKKDNPSGLPEYDDALEVPIFFK